MLKLLFLTLFIASSTFADSSAIDRAKALLDLESPPQTIEELTAGKYEQLVRINRFHDVGHQHSEMYRYQRDGKHRLIKVGNDEKADLRDLTGMVINEQAGGPQVMRAGLLRKADGSVAGFVEMEEIFAGESGTFTFKGAIRAKSFWPRPLPSDGQLTKLARMLTATLEQGISIGPDVDLIFSKKQNDVRWIDGAEWKLLPTPFFTTPENTTIALHSTVTFWIDFYMYFSLRGAEQLLRLLIDEIRASEAWSDQQKTLILKTLKWDLHKRYFVPREVIDAAFTGAEPIHMKPLLRYCADLLR